MYTQDVVIQAHESFFIDKSPLGKPNNPHFNSDARNIALNLAIRGNIREDGNGYITTFRTNKNTFVKLPKKNNKRPQVDPTMTVEEFVQTMTYYIFTDDEGELFYPEVYGFNPWIKILTTDMLNLVPSGLPNSTKSVIIDDTDPENPIYEDQLKTWHEWAQLDGNYSATISGDYTFILPSFCGKTEVVKERNRKITKTGVCLLGSELELIPSNGDAELVDEIS